MLVLAHRGDHSEARENTLAAFEAAIKLGAYGIETDVRASLDGRAVIIHDRLSAKQRPVVELTHRDLEHDMGARVPLLAEILEAFPDILWNVELKTAAAARCALPVLASFQRRCRLLVTSFRHDVIVQCADELEVDCGLLLAHRPLNIDAIIAGAAIRPRIKSIVWDYNIIDPAVLAAVTAAGWTNYVYGPITHSEHTQCLALELTGVITDYPQLALTIRG